MPVKYVANVQYINKIITKLNSNYNINCYTPDDIRELIIWGSSCIQTNQDEWCDYITFNLIQSSYEELVKNIECINLGIIRKYNKLICLTSSEIEQLNLLRKIYKDQGAEIGYARFNIIINRKK